MTEIANAIEGSIASLAFCWFGVQAVKTVASTFLIYMGKAAFDDVLKWFNSPRKKGMF